MKHDDPRCFRPRIGAIVMAVLAVAAPASAQTAVNWDDQSPRSGTVEEGRVFIETGQGGVFPLVILEPKELGPPGYRIEGTVRYEGVEGFGYMEMWSFFDGGGRYFSRTLGTAGEMAALSGDSPERPFALPFSLREQDPSPVRIEVNVVLPGAGRVWVGPLELRADDAGVPPTTTATAPSSAAGAEGAVVTTSVPETAPAPTTTVAAAAVEAQPEPSAWWSQALGWLLGGLLVAAPLVAVSFGGRYGPRWPTRLLAAGPGLLLISVLAIVLGQPLWVWMPLSAGGLLNLGVGLFARRLVRIDEEQRRMTALDALR